MEYTAIKMLHMSCAALSGSFFLVRGIWMLRASTLLDRRWVKILPQVIDSILLVSALTMVFWSGQYPFAQPWLGAKVVALVLYIILGVIALRTGRTLAVRASALAGALLAFAYIVSVAVTRQVVPFLG